MAFTPMSGRCTGFEMGTIDLSPLAYPYGSECAADTVNKHSGSYSCKIKNAWFQSNAYERFFIDAGTSEVYIGLWYYPGDLMAGAYNRIEFLLQGGGVISLHLNTFGMWDAYSATCDSCSHTLIASGTIPITTAWHHIAVRLNVADAGNLVTIVDGVIDIVFAGDTAPNAGDTDIAFVYYALRDVPNAHDTTSYIDDVTIGTGGYPADYRYEAVMPNADIDNTNWVGSAAGDLFELINEKPPSDVDYIYTITNAANVNLGVEAWNATDKTPAFVQYWARVMKDEAAAHQLQFVSRVADVTDPGTPLDLLAAYEYVAEIFLLSPDANAWQASDFTDLRLNMVATIV